MAVMREIPIVSGPDQSFVTTLMNRTCRFRVRHARRIDRWSFDLSVDDVEIVTGRRIVAGVNLLRPFGAGVGELIGVAFDVGAEPNLEDLPAGAFRLYAVDPDAQDIVS